MYRRVVTDDTGEQYQIYPEEGCTRQDALVSFLLRLSTDVVACVRMADLTESSESYFNVVMPRQDYPVAENTVYLQVQNVDYEIFEDHFVKNDTLVKNVKIHDKWEISKWNFNRIKQKLLKSCEKRHRFYIDYIAASEEGRHVRRFIGRFREHFGETYIYVRITESGEEMDLQEELAMEKERKEIISSLFEDWVYEYNIAEGKITTVSGSGNPYNMLDEQGKEQNKEQTYLCLDDLHPDDRISFLECCRGVGSDTGHSYTEARISYNGGYRWISLTTKVLCDAAGTPVSVIGRLSDIDEKKREELVLKEKARRDSLTGLLNRAAFEEDAEKILNMHDESKEEPLAMLIMDIDNFKMINDRHGHLYGDTVILTMTEAMREFAETGDVLGRFGGDEFTILTRNFSDEKDLMERVELLRQSFAAECAATDTGRQIACSVGVAVYGRDGKTLQELLMNSDKALYFVKEHGKNSSILCTEEMKESFTKNYEKKTEIDSVREITNVSKEITEFALELLEGSKDIKSAIQMLLANVGKRFSLTGVAIREEDSNNRVQTSYVWRDEKKISSEMSILYSQNDWRQVKKKLQSQQVIDLPDIEEEPEENILRKLYQPEGIRALLLCAISGAGEIFGSISFVDVLQGRQWSEEERHSLTVISKIIGNYLARERAYYKIEQKVNLMKSYDEVTGLLKYEKFKEVAQEILTTSQGRVKYAIISIDIAHFKYFNEEYGFRNGDEVLADFANLTVKHNTRAAAACRDYADNFIVMVTVSSKETLLHNIETYNRTFVLNQKEKFLDSNLEMCCGVYIVEDAKTDIIQAMDNANIARKLLKEKGTSGVLVFEAKMKVDRLRDIALLHMVEEAIEDGEFTVYLQPKFSLLTGELVGAEALARWNKPSGLLALPSEFIPTLEKSGKIVELDFFVYDAVLRQLRRWQQKNYPVVPISVNLSRHHIKNPQLVQHLVKEIQQFEIERSLIEIEITESAFVDDQAALLRVMQEIKEQGFRISIDDFGKGYSSLSMLTELPADIVKIDKDFLKNSSAVSTKGILNNVIRLIQDNQMKAVCEGIETKEQAQFLSNVGCDIGQGFYFAKPMSMKDFEARYFATKPVITE